jgi:hypothetical protein
MATYEFVKLSAQERVLALRSVHEWSARACSDLAERHASTAAGIEREVERLRAAAYSGRDAQPVRRVVRPAPNAERRDPRRTSPAGPLRGAYICRE